MWLRSFVLLWPLWHPWLGGAMLLRFTSKADRDLVRELSPIHHNGATLDTTGKPIVAECLGLCRVPDHGHSAKMWFSECQAADTRQKSGTRHAQALPSAGRRQIKALDNLCPVLAGRHSAKPEHVPSTRARRAPAVRVAHGVKSLPSVYTWHSAKINLCRVPPAGTRQSFFCRVLGLQHSANVVIFF